MHGPTFMANPLACAVANASLKLLETGEWQQQISFIENFLKEHLLALNSHARVKNSRVLGGIGVVETFDVVNMETIQKRFVELGVWIRPFGKLIYIMPPFISNTDELTLLVTAISTVLDEAPCFY